MRSVLLLALVAAAALAACSEQKPKQEAKAPAATPPAATQPTAPPAPSPAINLIREGVGVAGVELGMSSADVVRVLGQPVRMNKDGDRPVFMDFHANEIFGVYMDAAKDKVRLIIVARQDKTHCTAFDVCLYREGDLTKLKAHHGAKLLRYVDRDGSVSYRLLSKTGADQIMTEYTPNEERDGVVQVAMLYWTGPIDQSSLD
jgi:hypothetical protein